MPIDVGYESEIDAALKTWQQGDAIVGERLPFLHLSDLSKPLSSPSRKEAESGFEVGENLASIGVEMPGFVVVSQTCDLLKPCSEWFYVQLAALQSTDDNLTKEVQKGLRPNFASVPALVDRKLVANLDLLMTVEKSVLAGISKNSFVRGVRSDSEARAFAEAVCRRFVRFAFPDDFVKAVRPLQERIKSKHGRASNEGRAYRELREIRVVASPGWESPRPAIEFLFVRNKEGPVSQELDDAIESLMARFVASGKFDNPRHRIVSLWTMTASLYLASDRLDLDYLSKSTK